MDGEITMETLGDMLPKEMSRVRTVLGYYKEMGAPGMFGATMIERSLRMADEAVIEGDIVAMMQAYEDLKTIE